MLILFRKIKTWLKCYWYVPIIILVGILLIVLGLPVWKGDDLKKILKNAQDSNKKQQAAIKEIEEEKKSRKEAEMHRYNEMIAALEIKYEVDEKKIDRETKKYVKDLIKKHRNDPRGMAKEFAEEFGLIFTVPVETTKSTEETSTDE